MRKIESAYSYSVAMVDVNGIAREYVKALGYNIKQEDLFEGEGYGVEKEPHVTVLYGLHTADTDVIAECVKEFGSVSFKFKGLSLFENEEYDVLKFDIESQDLTHLNNCLSALPHTNEYPTYNPHCTIAYIKKGLGKNYLNIGTCLEGFETSSNVLNFSKKNDMGNSLIKLD